MDGTELSKKGLLAKCAVDGSCQSQIPDIIEFCAPTVFCNEGDGEVKVDVVRSGTATATIQVDFRTEDGSAVAGRRYKAVSGSLIFPPGMMRLGIRVPILDNTDFEAVLHFRLKLENVQGARLGTYLNTCEVQIVDDDAFPTNKFRDKLLSGKIADIPKWPLMVEYLRMILQDTRMLKKFWLSIMCGQLSNIKYIYTILMINYLVDEVLNHPAPPENLSAIIGIYVVLMHVPFLITILAKLFRTHLKIRGLALNMLQCKLMRKFLNYDDAARHAVSPSDVQMAITRDVPELVDDLFLAIFDIADRVGRLLLFLISMLVQIPSKYTVLILSLFLCFPLAMVVFLRLRLSGTAARRKALFRAQTAIVGSVQQSTDCFRLISDYFQRPAMVNAFVSRVIEQNSAFFISSKWELINVHFAQLLTTIAVAIFLYSSHQDVLDKVVPLGAFLTSLGMLSGIGDCYGELYANLLQMQRASAPLLNIVYYMNLPVDTPERLRLSRKQLAQSLKAQMPLSSSKETYDSSQGSMSIWGKNVDFIFPEFTGGNTSILDKASFNIPLGNLVAITGGRGSGKATVIKLLGGVLHPAEESEDSSLSLFVPSHLRVLHVSAEPVFIADFTVLENLCFGPSDGQDESPERVLTICRRMGVSESVLSIIQREIFHLPGGAKASVDMLGNAVKRNPSMSDVEERFVDVDHGTSRSVAKRRHAALNAHWSSVLSRTDQCLIHIARALVMNPEVMVLHQPLAHFDEQHRALVVRLMREFVDLRGIEEAGEEYALRRPRTCVFSSSTLDSSEIVDMAFHVGGGKVDSVDMQAMIAIRTSAKELFASLDRDKDNRVTVDEFTKACITTPWLLTLFGIPDEQARNSPEEVVSTLKMVFSTVDQSGSGDVDFEELMHFLKRRLDSDVSRVLASLSTDQAPQNWDMPQVPREVSIMKRTPITFSA